MKKIVVWGMIICMVLLTGCGNGSDSLKNFTEDKLKEMATVVIDEYNAKEYESIIARFPKDLQANITSNQLKQAWDSNFPDAGAFQEYKDFSYAEKEENGFVVVKVAYENTSVQYTLSFNKDMELTNFFLK